MVSVEMLDVQNVSVRVDEKSYPGLIIHIGDSQGDIWVHISYNKLRELKNLIAPALESWEKLCEGKKVEYVEQK